MPAAKPRILITDDEPKYVRALTMILQAQGYEILPAPDGETAVALAAREAPALILLDVRIPKLNGREACRQMREFSLAPLSDGDRHGPRNRHCRRTGGGADDCVIKPCAIDRLLACLKIVLGWNAYGQELTPYELGDLKVDYAQHQVSIAQRPVPLTPDVMQRAPARPGASRFGSARIGPTHQPTPSTG